MRQGNKKEVRHLSKVKGEQPGAALLATRVVQMPQKHLSRGVISLSIRLEMCGKQAKGSYADMFKNKTYPKNYSMPSRKSVESG